MVQKQRLDDFDFMLAKIDTVAKIQKTGIAESVHLIMIVTTNCQDFHVWMCAPNGSCISGVWQLGMADPQIVERPPIKQIRKRLQHCFMLPGAKRVYQEGFVVKEQIGAINNVIGCWVQCRIDLAKLCREATIILLGIFPDTVAIQ